MFASHRVPSTLFWVSSIVSVASFAYPKIDPSDRESVLFAYRDWHQAPIPALEWTGDVASCRPGTTSLAHQQRTIDQVNFYRAMVGLPEVKLSLNSAKYQAAALIMLANRALSHQPAPEWKCHTPEGAEGARANIALGMNGPLAIDKYVSDEGDRNTAVGHRRWILFPGQISMATGDTTGTNSLGVFEDMTYDRVESPEFVAWPSPGYFPAPLLPRSRWSISVKGADFSAAQVSVKETAMNQELSAKVLPVNDGYGDNTLVWEMAPIQVSKGTERIIDVVVSKARVRGVEKSYSYQVKLFQP